MISHLLMQIIKVETSSGIVDGYKKGRVLYWDDIPYAKPPINELRWKGSKSC